MKISFIFLFIFSFQLLALDTKAQDAVIELKTNSMTVGQLINEIEKQTNYLVVYSNREIDANRKVDVNRKSDKVSAYLNEIFTGTDIRYDFENNYIVLMKKANKNAATVADMIRAAQQQGKTITGKVVDESNSPLPGVTVTIKGTNHGTITDAEGNYSINNVPDNAYLVFSFVGMSPQEVAVGNKRNIDVTLLENIQSLKEVVVSALGIKRQRQSIGYSTAEVGGDKLTQARDLNLGNALSGKVAGVMVQGNATGVGGSSRVIIRGNASLTGNNQPLYVVDGVPFDNTNQSSAGQWGGMDLGDGLSNINPDDIDNIQVLKGAAAAALYGYRGANGAILITTKSGKEHKNGVGIEFNNNLTFNPIYDYRDFQKVYGQGTQGTRPSNQTAAFQTYNQSWGEKLDGKDFVNRLGQTVPYEYVDNWDNFYKVGLDENTSLAFSGKSDKISYRFGISNIYSKGNLPNSSQQQQSISMNTIYDITNKLQLTANLNYVFEKVGGRSRLSDGNNNTNATLLYLANGYDVRWLKGPNGNGDDTDGSEYQPGNNVYFSNPYWLQYRQSNKSNRNRTTGALTLRYDIVDWLYIQGQISRDGYIMDFKLVQPDKSATDPGGYIQEYEKNFSEMNMNYLLGFNKTVNDFSINATFGGNKQHNLIKQYGTDGGIRPFIVSGFYSTSNVNSSTRTFAKDYSEYEVNSLYGTADFGYKDWVFLNFTGRNDWFSTLDPENNSYFYPSANLSWMLSNSFNLPSWITTAKLRASLASASNGTQPYQTMLTYALNNFNIQGQSMGYINNSSVPNAKLMPVKISEKEVGANASFLKNRLGFDFAAYEKKTTNDIVQVSTSETSGFSSAYKNIGRIRNRGIEAMIFGVPFASKNFMWNTSINLTYNTSKVLYLGEGVNSLTIDGAVSRSGNASICNIVGQSYGQIVGYKYKTDDKGNRVYTSDGFPVRSDQVETLGNGVYKWTGGFSNDFSYKNFNLSFLIDFKLGAKIFSGTNYNLYLTGLQKNTLEGRDGGISVSGVDENGNAFSKSGINAQTYWQWIANNTITEEFVYDASFAKLRELSLGYNLPNSFLKRSLPFVQSLQLSLVGRNLWTIFKHTPNIDPESSYNNTNGQGLELNGYPSTRNIGFNLNIKF